MAAYTKASLTGAYEYELKSQTTTEIVAGTATFDGAGNISYTKLGQPNAVFNDGVYDVYPDGTGYLMMRLSDGRGPGAGPFFKFNEAGGFAKINLISDTGVPMPYSGTMERA